MPPKAKSIIKSNAKTNVKNDVKTDAKSNTNAINKDVNKNATKTAVKKVESTTKIPVKNNKLLADDASDVLPAKPVEKKRGRPTKESVANQKKNYIDIKSSDSSDESDSEELVLQLPNINKLVTRKENHFTIAEETFNDASASDISDFENNGADIQSTNRLLTMSTDIQDKLKKQDMIIKTLTDALKNQKHQSQENVLQTNKENKSILLNLGLITCNNNKLCVAEKSNYACWWCTYNFDSYPLFIPERYHDNKYYVFGNFCSFSCMMAYNRYDLNDFRTNLRDSLIKKMYSDIFKCNCAISPSPKRELFEKFGGVLKIEDIRNNKNICNKIMKISIPPMIPLLSSYEESLLNK